MRRAVVVLLVVALLELAYATADYMPWMADRGGLGDGLLLDGASPR